MVEYIKLDDVKIQNKKKVYNPFSSFSVVMILVIINIILFMVQITIPAFTQYFILDSSQILSRPWTLLTAMFLHGSFSHLFFNMYALLLFGSLLERKIGSKRFVYLYLILGVIVSAISTLFYERMLGASGAIMGVIGTLIVLMPRLKLLFLFVIPMNLWVAGVVWFLLDFFGIFIPSNVANIAHLVGMILGLAYGYYLYRKRKKFFKKLSKKKNVDLDDAKEHSKIYR